MVYLVCSQLLNHLKKLHEKGFTHNDLKQTNVLGDQSDDEKFYLIDFGLATRYLGSNGQHKSTKFRGTFSGNILFATSN